jgi:hypothetical protein
MVGRVAGRVCGLDLPDSNPTPVAALLLLLFVWHWSVVGEGGCVIYVH